MAKLTFFHCPRTCSLASFAALEESGLPFDAREINLRSSDAVGAYRLINPTGTVPALLIGDVLLTENLAILSYVAKSSPEMNLIPSDAEGMARCLSLMAWMASTVHITRRMRSAPFRFVEDEAAQERIREVGQVRFWENLKRVDAKLDGNPWLLGKQMSVADFYALAFYDWGTRDGYNMPELEAYTALKDRLAARPGVARALRRERSILAESA